MRVLNPLLSAWLKIERADKHIQEVEDSLAIIEGPDSHRTVTHYNPRTRKHTVEARFIFEPFENLVCAAGDAVHNLRCALDHLAWQVALQSDFRARGVAEKDVSFRIYRSITSYNAAVAKGSVEKVGGQPWAVFIDKQHPYQGGNALLWALVLADDHEKHRQVIRLAAWANTVELRKVQGTRIAYGPAFWYPLEEDAKVGVYWSTGPDFKADMEMRVSVAFSEIGGLEREPVVTSLRQFSDMVKRILTDARQDLFL